MCEDKAKKPNFYTFVANLLLASFNKTNNLLTYNVIN